MSRLRLFTVYCTSYELCTRYATRNTTTLAATLLSVGRYLTQVKKFFRAKKKRRRKRRKKKKIKQHLQLVVRILTTTTTTTQKQTPLLLIITRPQYDIDYPLWPEAKQVWATNQPSLESLISDLQTAGFYHVHATIERYPCRVSLQICYK